MKSILKTLYQNSKNKEIKELIFKAFSKDWYTRGSIAKNSNIPDYILEKLSNDESKYVRSFVAKNPITPIHILEKLNKDEDITVRNTAFSNITFRSYETRKFIKQTLKPLKKRS